jgi:hypothetical protein
VDFAFSNCAKGKVEIEEIILEAGDAIGIYETELIKINGVDDSELVFVEVPIEKGIQP